MEGAEKQPPKQLIPYTWKKGQSGNPNGRPKGKTLKEFAREYLMTLPDEEKVDYLASLPTEIVWKMAEGNPESKTELKIDDTHSFTDTELDEAQKIIEQRLSEKTTPKSE